MPADKKSKEMKLQLSLLLLLFLSSFSKSIQAQSIKKIGYYKTYQDYLNNDIEKMDECDINEVYQPEGKIVFKLDGKKIKIDSKDIWGFQDNNGNLYRITHPENHQNSLEPHGVWGMAIHTPTYIYKVIDIGKFILYYYGPVRQGINGNGYIETEAFYTYSTDLNGEMKGIDRKLDKEWEDTIVSEHPEWKPLFDCVGTGRKAFSNLQSCVKDFNRGLLN